MPATYGRGGLGRYKDLAINFRSAAFQTKCAQHVFLNAMLTDDERWTAVLRRDPRADFYYAVKTTGVYCRPACASRRPRRENASFHATTDDAEARGFRPCLRCRPKEATLREQHTAAVVRACRLIENAEETPDLATLAAATGLSPFHFHRIFKSVTGVTPKEYAAAHRTIRVRDELAKSRSVTDALYGAGFNSSGGFYAISTALLGMKPAAFRSGGKAASIRYAVTECSLGAVLVAATDHGVCAILLGENPLRDLEARFPHARLIGDDSAFAQIVARAVQLADVPASSLPADVRGTALQQRVARFMLPSSATCSTSAPSARPRSMSTSPS